jgi:hypothetical protein
MLYASIETISEQHPFMTIAHPYRTREKRERKGEREGERGRADTKDKKQKPEKTQVQ